MRPMLIVLMVSFVALQHKLWLGDGNVIQWMQLQKKLNLQQTLNNQLVTRNKALEADIQELKSGNQALEEQARAELGMVKEGEVFYQFLD